MKLNQENLRLFKALVFSMLFVFSAHCLKAQDVDGVHSFLVAGVSMNIPKNNKLLLYVGHSPTDNVKAFVALPIFKVHKYITLTPGYTYVNVNLEDNPTITEHHLLAIATFSIPVAEKWTFANRNMYFHRFRENIDDLSFYRNRIGIIHQAELFKKQTSVFLHNEFYLNIDSGQFTRNRIILGGDIKLFKWLTPQIMYMYQSDSVLENRHLGWLIVTIPLENFGVFSRKLK